MEAMAIREGWIMVPSRCCFLEHFHALHR